ncbi:regulator [Streptomyces sp. NPDC004690]
MTAALTSAERSTITLLSSPALIRLITEIDDHGAIPTRRLAATLCDLSPHQLRRATDAARAHGLVRTAPGGLDLTEAGLELADLYDATARWARRHDYPARVCDFTARIRHTLDLLHRPLDGPRSTASKQSPGVEAAADLHRPRVLLAQWLTAHHSTPLAEFEPAA